MASPVHSLSSTQYSIGQDSQTSSPWDSRRVPTTPSIPPKGQPMNLDQSVPKTPDVLQQLVQFCSTSVGTAVALPVGPSSGTPSRCYGNEDTFASTSDQQVPSTPSGVEYYQSFSHHQTAACADKSPLNSSQSTYLIEHPDRLVNEISSTSSSGETSNSMTDAHHRCRPRRRLCLNKAYVTSSGEDEINRSLPLVDRREFTNDVNHQSLAICVDEATVSGEERSQKAESAITSVTGCKSSNEKSTLENIGNGGSSVTVNFNLRIRNCSSFNTDKLEINDAQAGAGEKETIQRHTQGSSGSDVVDSEGSRAFPMSLRCSALKRADKSGADVLPKGYDSEKRLEIERRVLSVQRGHESDTVYTTANGKSTTTFLFEDDDIFA